MSALKYWDVGTSTWKVVTGTGEVPLTFAQSLSRAVNTITLANDSAAPGSDRFYGTSNSGVKGYFPLPVTNTSTPLNTVLVTQAQTALALQAHMAYTVPAGLTQQGTVYHLHAWGSVDNGTTNCTFSATVFWGGIGGTAILQTGFQSSAVAAVGRFWYLDANVLFRNVGNPCSAGGDIVLVERSSSGAANQENIHCYMQAPPVATLDTTVAKDITLAFTLSTTTGAPVIRTLGGFIQIVR